MPSTARASWLVPERLRRSRRSATALGGEIAAWLCARRADPAFARFAGHFEVLDHVLRCMLDAVLADLDRIDPTTCSSGRLYERCRAVDTCVWLVRRVFGWYAAKYDQRTGTAGPVLRAADEVVRSCWTEAFGALGRRAPSGPLVYLDHRFDAAATPRLSVPSDLRAPRDAVVAEFVRELPIPVIALPALCSDEPWWLVLAAHETGHHVQHDLGPDLVGRTRDALGAVAGAEHEAACWSAWAMESFADAFAALAMGPAAAWAVDELQHADPAQLLVPPSPGQRYPPVPVRTALLGELARAAGAPDPGPGAAAVLGWLAEVPAGHVPDEVKESLAAHLGHVPEIARTLVELAVDGVALREICGWEPDQFAADGPVARWAKALAAGSSDVAGRGLLSAARHAMAGGVAAYRSLGARAAGERPDGMDELRSVLPAALEGCGPTGHLAGAPTASNLDAVARRLTSRLLAAPAADGGEA